MSEMVLQNRGRMFAASAVGTLAIGVGAAVMVIFAASARPRRWWSRRRPKRRWCRRWFTSRKPGPIRRPLRPGASRGPARAAAASPPPMAAIQATGVWDGVWRRKKYPLPMFRLNPSGDAVAGTCVPNWGTVVQFRDGAVTGDALEFVVDDQVFRVHVRMTRVGDDKAKVEQWVTDADWETSLERAMRAARTPQQARLARRSSKWTRKSSASR